MYIRKNDVVVVMSGDDKGKRGRVLSVDSKTNKIIVEGINKVYKHVKPSQRNRQGGRLSKEMPLSVSKVMLIDPTTNEATRVGLRYLPDGSKELFAKKSGTTLRRLSKPRAAYAKK
jgi:large subunit ribosomal protein L24